MSAEPRGVAFPFRIDPATGGVRRAGGDEKIKENLRHLLLTGIGERVMRRDYGGGLRELVHDPNNDALRAIVQHRIAKAVAQHEPRIELQAVVVTQLDGTRVVGSTGGGGATAPPAAGTGSQLVARLRYTVRRTQRPESVAIPLEVGGT